MAQPYMETARMLDRDLKRGSTEMLIMAMVEDRPRHGYEIEKLIEQRSHGVLQSLGGREETGGETYVKF